VKSLETWDARSAPPSPSFTRLVYSCVISCGARRLAGAISKGALALRASGRANPGWPCQATTCPGSHPWRFQRNLRRKPDPTLPVRRLTVTYVLHCLRDRISYPVQNCSTRRSSPSFENLYVWPPGEAPVFATRCKVVGQMSGGDISEKATFGYHSGCYF
jgi:hypothetical protein